VIVTPPLKYAGSTLLHWYIFFDCMSARHTHSIVNSVHGANDSNNNVKEIKLNRMLTVS
jgi:hypothetical protein